MTDMKKEFMTAAIRLAIENVKNGGGPFGAVVVKNNEIIGKGVNTVTSSNDPTAHAEVNAIRNACAHLSDFQLNDCEIYASCEPCPMCLGAIYWARPKAIYFAASKMDAANAGFDDSFIYEEIPKKPQQRSIITKEIPHEEKLHPFISWNESEEKTRY
jgi:guanine deaminase